MFHKNFPSHFIATAVLGITLFSAEPKVIPHTELALYASEVRHLQKAFAEIQVARQAILDKACKDAGIKADSCITSDTEIKEKVEVKPIAPEKGIK